MFICQTPGIWGALPKGFKSLWEVSMDIYFTYNVSSSAFSFKPGRSLCKILITLQTFLIVSPTFSFLDSAERVFFHHNKYLDICMQVS